MKKNLLGAFFALLLSITANAQCSQYPTLSLGNDTLLCQGQSLSLAVPAGYDSYTWNVAPGNQPSVTITTPTTLILNVANFTQNLVVNGDFEAGDTGFTTGYAYGTSPAIGGILWDESTYAITTNPNLVHSSFFTCSDVGTTGPGNMIWL